MLQQSIGAARRLAMFVLPVAALLSLPAGALAQNAFDPAIFKTPPAAYRGHAMWNFPLSTLNEASIVAGIQEMAKLNYGGFFIEAGGGPTTGLSEAYLKMFRRPRTAAARVRIAVLY